MSKEGDVIWIQVGGEEQKFTKRVVPEISRDILSKTYLIFLI